MFERFDDQARRVVSLASQERELLAHPFIGAEHLLLGLLRESDGVGAQILGELGVDLERAREQVRAKLGEGSEPVRGHIPFTEEAKGVLVQALREAGRGRPISTQHLLLGLVTAEKDSDMLRALGIDEAAVRAAVAAGPHGE